LQEKSTTFPCGLPLFNRRCVRVLDCLRSKNAGLGHQIAELIFSLTLSVFHDATFVYESFPLAKNDHNVSLAFVDELFGLKHVFSSKWSKDLELKSLRPLSIQTSQRDVCNVRFQGTYRDCPGGVCFFSESMSHTFDRFAPCLRELSLVHGTWSSRKPKSMDSTSLNVVWHFRLGDLESHMPDDPFFRQLSSTLAPVFESAVCVRHYFVANWNIISEQRRVTYQDALQSQFKYTSFVAVDLEQTLLYFLHADIMIGSGSSLPRVAGLFSSIPLIVNIRPFHGWNHKAEYFSDGIDADNGGRVRTPIEDVFHKLRLKGIEFKFKSGAFNKTTV